MIIILPIQLSHRTVVRRCNFQKIINIIITHSYKIDTNFSQLYNIIITLPLQSVSPNEMENGNSSSAYSLFMYLLFMYSKGITIMILFEYKNISV